jgi:hypothetical protein
MAEKIRPSVIDTHGKEPVALFAQVFGAVIGFLLIMASLWAFIQLILGGFNWISSGGDKGKLEEARHRIQNAVLGLLITFAAWAIFLLLMDFFGINQGTDSGFQIQLPGLFD